MRIYLDDIRFPSKGEGVTIVRDYNDFVFTWIHNKQNIISISFDHDLGTGKTGYDAICIVEADYHLDLISHDIELNCHSANTSGADKIRQAIDSIHKFREGRHNDE